MTLEDDRQLLPHAQPGAVAHEDPAGLDPLQGVVRVNLLLPARLAQVLREPQRPAQVVQFAQERNGRPDPRRPRPCESDNSKGAAKSVGR